MKLRERDPLAFAEAMVEAHKREFETMAQAPGPAIFDRGLPDVVGFLEVSGLPVLSAIDAACRAMRYEGTVFRLPAWRAIYRKDSERIQDWDAAIASDEAVTAVWQRYGYVVRDLPLAPVSERLAILRAAL